MSIRGALLCIALGTSAMALPGMSYARVNVDIDIAPPAARVEVVPAPRAGYIWAAGYWSWSGHKHVWVAGHWNRARHGEHWVADRWEQRGAKWHRDAGHWERDH